MVKSTNIKIGALVLALSLLCAGVILLGSTFASNVDYSNGPETTPPPNSPNYKVSLQSHTKNNTVPVDMITSDGEVTDNNFAQNAFWCPGRTEIFYLKLENHEAFPVNCTLNLIIKDSGFGNTLSYAVIPGLTANAANHPDNWAAFKEQSAVKGVLNTNPGTYKLHEDFIALFPAITGENQTSFNDEAYLAVAIHMDEQASNEYQEKTANLRFSLQVDANHLPGATPTPTPSVPENN